MLPNLKVDTRHPDLRVIIRMLELTKRINAKSVAFNIYYYSIDIYMVLYLYQQAPSISLNLPQSATFSVNAIILNQVYYTKFEELAGFGPHTDTNLT